MPLLVTPHMTVPPEHQLVAKTHRGMAHWAGTGPDGMTCGGCQHFKPQSKNVSDGVCTLVLPGTPKKRGAAYKFPASTASCRHYEARP